MYAQEKENSEIAGMVKQIFEMLCACKASKDVDFRSVHNELPSYKL